MDLISWTSRLSQIAFISKGFLTKLFLKVFSKITSFYSLSFKVSRSSLLIEQPVKKRPLLDTQVINSVCVQPELQNNTKHADNSSDTEMEDMIAEGSWMLLDTLWVNFDFYYLKHNMDFYSAQIFTWSIHFYSHIILYFTKMGKLTRLLMAK